VIDDNKEIFFHYPFVLWQQAILNGDSKRGSAPLAGVWAVGATPCGRPYQQYRFGVGIAVSPQASTRLAATNSPHRNPLPRGEGINRGLKNQFSVEGLINDVIDAETSSA